MITKPLEQKDTPSDPRLRAGVEAEQQMAFYLHRAFANDDSVHVLHDLRLVDPKQPEHTGKPGVCQIDHLILHRFGHFIVESKSVTSEVIVRSDGDGGDEWARVYKGRERGFPSPIQQARRQGEFLRTMLGHNQEHLLGKMPLGLRTVFRFTLGTDQRGFVHMPVQVIVAISDQGRITRKNDWKERTNPFRDYVCKADLVTEKIKAEIAEHRWQSNPLSGRGSDYGIWSVKADELPVIAEWLTEQHTPRTAAPTTDDATLEHAADPSPDSTAITAESESDPATLAASDTPESATAELTTPPPAACKSCDGTTLTAKWGKYGYYWKCDACGANTAMPTVCSNCGSRGSRATPVRIHKTGPEYYRHCHSCDHRELVWTELE